MLEVKIKSIEMYDDVKQEFIYTKGATLHLEHSLLSISKWESKWHKPFIENSNKMSKEEIIDYIKCMTLPSNNIDDNVYLYMSKDNIDEILAYIQNPMTATWFSEDKNTSNKKIKKEIITSELIYYWMIALQIPFECQKWHLNRLMTLIRVCQAKNEEQNPKSKKKISQREMMARAEALNAQRRAQLHSKG